MSQLTRRVLLEFPAQLTVTVVSNTRIDLAWTPVLNVVSYRVYRNGVLTDSPTTEAISATGLTGSTQYLFAVACVDALGQEGPKSPTSPGTTLPTPDTVGPTAPTISAGSATLSSVIVSLLVPATDPGSGVASYTLERANNSAFTSSLVTTSGLTPASFPLTVSNLLSGTTYWFRLRGIDNAGNLGTFSAAVSITTTVVQNPSLPPYWPNWPASIAQCVQAARATVINASMAADHSLIVTTSFKPTASRMQAECDAIDNIRAQQDSAKIQTKVFQYLTPSVTYKVLSTPQVDNERSFNLELILDPDNGSPLVSGSPTWKVHRVGQRSDAGLCETQYAPLTDHQVNITAGAGVNSLGEDYATAYWKKYDNAWTSAYKSRLSGFFHDVFNQVPATMRQNNGAITVSDPDYNGDGVTDVRTNFNTSGGNGGRQWSLGGLNTIAKYRARFGDKHVVTNTANFPGNYNVGDGPLPIPTVAPLYRKLDFPFQETMEAFLSLTATHSSSGTGWTVAGTPGDVGRLTAFFEAYYVQEAMARLESDIGSDVKGGVLMHSNLNERTPTSADLEAMRFMSLACMLVERAIPCISAGAAIVWTLDEMLVDFGNPIGARTMGTFNLSTAVLTLKNPDFFSGTFGKIFFGNFEKVLLLVNGATPSTGAYPSADAAVTVPLSAMPSPGTGMKYQFLGPNHTNTRIGRTTRNQSPTINTGADVTSAGVGVKPYHARLLRKVPA